MALEQWGSAAPALSGNRIDQRQGLRGLERFIEESIGAETDAAISVLGIPVIGEDHLDRRGSEAMVPQRPQHIESAAGREADVDRLNLANRIVPVTLALFALRAPAATGPSLIGM